MRRVINLAASMSPANTWTPALEGVTVRNAYPGRSGLQGILAVELHRAGFTGLADAPADVYGTILADQFEPARALEDWGGAAAHRAELLQALRLLPVQPSRARRARRHPAPRAERLARRGGRAPRWWSSRSGRAWPTPAPATCSAAKFSIPWAVAAALVLGHGDVAAFTDEAGARRSRIRDLAARVTVTVDREMTPRRSDYPTSRLRLSLRDGRVLEGETGVVRGDADNPVPEAEVLAKFEALAAPVLGAHRAGQLVAAVLAIEEVKNVAHLGALLSPPA